MSKTGKFSTYHVTAVAGRWYTPGEIVRIDQTEREIQIVKDPAGEYEVYSCRQATEYAGDPPLLRVGLRRSSATDRLDPSRPRELFAI